MVVFHPHARPGRPPGSGARLRVHMCPIGARPSTGAARPALASTGEQTHHLFRPVSSSETKQQTRRETLFRHSVLTFGDGVVAQPARSADLSERRRGREQQLVVQLLGDLGPPRPRLLEDAESACDGAPAVFSRQVCSFRDTHAFARFPAQEQSNGRGRGGGRQRGSSLVGEADRCSTLNSYSCRSFAWL